MYGGHISALSTVRDKTNKPVFFTEQGTFKGGDFAGDLAWHTENVVIGTLRNWGQTVIEWNLAADNHYGPHTSGGCVDCKGALTVTGKSYKREVSYYIISQASKVIRQGAVRIESNETDSIKNVAFENTDGSTGVLAFNTKGWGVDATFHHHGKSFVTRIPPRTVASFQWKGTSSEVEDLEMQEFLV